MVAVGVRSKPNLAPPLFNQVLPDQTCHTCWASSAQNRKIQPIWAPRVYPNFVNEHQVKVRYLDGLGIAIYYPYCAGRVTAYSLIRQGRQRTQCMIRASLTCSGDNGRNKLLQIRCSQATRGLRPKKLFRKE